LFGGLSFTLYPVCVALACSAVMSTLGGPGLFVFTAASAASAVVFGLYRVMKRPSPPAEAQGPFRSLPHTTPVVSPLDPRGEDEPQFSLDLESAPKLEKVVSDGKHAAE
jgi:hypothetical protein